MPRAASSKTAASPAAKSSSSPASTVSRKKSTGARKLSAYNIYMKSELVKIKAERPGIAHRDAFKIAASRWKTTKESESRKAVEA
ncbi:hypothetical protein EV182_003651 [Spiromyces aspiralis]|uniref:Uncharacterized protein n=1 Tax=Spiromyces aspiralis TaxID=68401 RepID=A0ACC1HGM8_9FUNG|nr:hypothetical protein EV182_003651 [Spiromyces aspiralis]